MTVAVADNVLGLRDHRSMTQEPVIYMTGFRFTEDLGPTYPKYCLLTCQSQ